MVTITRTSPFSRKVNTMTFNISQDEFNAALARYEAGALLQNAFPMLDADEREFIKTGITPQEWDALFGGGEEN